MFYKDVTWGDDSGLLFYDLEKYVHVCNIINNHILGLKSLLVVATIHPFLLYINEDIKKPLIIKI